MAVHNSKLMHFSGRLKKMFKSEMFVYPATFAPVQRSRGWGGRWGTCCRAAGVNFDDGSQLSGEHSLFSPLLCHFVLVTTTQQYIQHQNGPVLLLYKSLWSWIVQFAHYFWHLYHCIVSVLSRSSQFLDVAESHWFMQCRVATDHD